MSLVSNEIDSDSVPRKDNKVIEMKSVGRRKIKASNSRFVILNRAGIEIVDPTAWFNAFTSNQNNYDHMLKFFNGCTDQEKEEICNTFKDQDGRCFKGMAQMRAHIANFDQDDFERCKTYLMARFPNAF